MMDALLEWMSYRHHGRIADLPESLLGERIPRTVVERMSVLGHVEFADKDRWRIAPPVLAGVSQSGDLLKAILCGARTTGFLSRLRASCERHGAVVSTAHRADMPALIDVTSSRCSALTVAADETGAVFQIDSPIALLACTPAVQDWPRTPCAMVRGRVETVYRFSRSKLEWVESTLDQARDSENGFFRIKRDWDWVSIIKMGSDRSAYIDDHAGRLIVARKVKAASWDTNTRTFSVPKQLAPPRLITRALAICSGKPPNHDPASGRVRFADVPAEVVKLTLAITGLRLS